MRRLNRLSTGHIALLVIVGLMLMWLFSLYPG
jgi:hypothetical protein